MNTNGHEFNAAARPSIKRIPRTSPIRKLVRLVLNLPEIISFSNLRRVRDTARVAGWRTAAAEVRRKCWGSGSGFYRTGQPASTPLSIPSSEIPAPLPLTVSVIIPTLNAGMGFRHTLNMFSGQEGFQSLEIICVDSGSSDGTREAAEACGAQVVPFSEKPFHHGEARNAGAAAAGGDLLLFTVQDALPPSSTWLRALYELKQRHHCAAASCTEFLPMESDLFYRALAWKHYRFIGAHGADRISTELHDASPAARQQSGQLSSIALLIDRGLFEQFHFRGAYGEDLDLGIRLLRAGHTIGFFDSVQIIHHHNRPASYYLKRGFTDRYAQGAPAAQNLPAPDEVLSNSAKLQSAIHLEQLDDADGYRALADRLLGLAKQPPLSDRIRPAVRELLEFLDASGMTFDPAGAETFRTAVGKAVALQSGALAAEAALAHRDKALAQRMMEGV